MLFAGEAVSALWKSALWKSNPSISLKVSFISIQIHRKYAMVTVATTLVPSLMEATIRTLLWNLPERPSRAVSETLTAADTDGGRH
ncbi:MAG: hypothetical protein AVDCRST_MAG56-5527 [uncultured Cytophagales bacterium]|uniref:Uncharacterized protein n=1 Tax=uncultured Cytophagales bacterium TaxID=158755 RepID=A0A6J4KCN1_9SPHI|nr:MAG: hypothetical protein AVDCRST_MAG56-5527 [uncultured Cytophagales bacterium]